MERRSGTAAFLEERRCEKELAQLWSAEVFFAMICGSCGQSIAFSTAPLLEGTSFDDDDLSIRVPSQPEIVRVISAVTALAVDAGCSGLSLTELTLGNGGYSILHASIRDLPIFFAVSTQQNKQIEQNIIFLAHVYYLASTLLKNQYSILLEKLSENLKREMDRSTFKDTMGRTPHKTLITEDLFEDEEMDGIDQVHIHEELTEFENLFITRLERERHEFYRAFAFEPLHGLGGGGQHPFFLCATNSAVKGKRDIVCLYQGCGAAFLPLHKEVVQGYCDTSKGIGWTRLLLIETGEDALSCVLASIGAFVLVLCLPPSLCANIVSSPLCDVSEYRAWDASALPAWVASRWFETLRRMRCLFPRFSSDDLDPNISGSPTIRTVAESIFDPLQRMKGALQPVPESQEQEGGEQAREAYEKLYSQWDGFVHDEVEEEQETEGPRPASPVEARAGALVEPSTPQSGPASFRGITPQPPHDAKTQASKKGGARFFRLFTASSDP